MDELTQERKWLSLGQASKRLGINPVTLRIWADTGKVRFIRTPGGHRRFSEEDITALYEDSRDRADASDLDLMVQSALGRARWEMDRHDLAGQGWYRAFDSLGRSQEQQLGRRLLALLVRYVAGGGESQEAQERILAEGRQVGEKMGLNTAKVGLSLSETVRAFLLFEDSVLDAVVPALSRPGRIDERDLRVRARARSFMHEVLFTLLNAYQKEMAG